MCGSHLPPMEISQSYRLNLTNRNRQFASRPNSFPQE